VAGAGLTCDAGQALAPAGAEPVVLAYAGPTSVPLGDTIPLAVVVERDGVPLDDARILVTSSDTNVLAVRAGGDSLVARRRGVVTLSLRLPSAILPDGGETVDQSIRVTAARLTLDRESWTFGSVDESITLDATALDAIDREIPDVAITWSSSDPTVADVSPGGRVTAKGVGTSGTGVATIEARIAEDGITATATMQVQQRATSLVFTPEQLRFDALQVDEPFAVEARDANGYPIPGIAPTLASCNPSVATLTTTGAVRSVANGATCIVARSGSADDTLDVTVDQQAIRVTILAPSGQVIRAIGGTLELEAVGYDRTNRPIGDTPPRWYLHPDDAGNVLVDAESGTVEGIAEGSALIVAAVDTATATVAIEVHNYADSIVIAPADTTFTSVGDAAVLRSSAYNERGVLIAGATPSWRTLDPAVASVSAAGQVTGLAEGVARVVASRDDVSREALVRVRNVPVSLAVTPELDTLPWLGFTRQLTLEARNARGDAMPATSFDWVVDDATVATVSATGLVTARAVGETWVRARARDGGLADQTRIVVTNDPMSLVLDAVVDTLTALGQTVQFTATVRNGAGAVLNVPITWGTSDPAVLAVDGSGRTTSTAFGEAVVTASAGSSSDAVAVTVLNPTRLYVDNGVVSPVRVGTLKRPYLRIGTALAAADAFDTVVVRRGASAYAEALTLSKRVTILGDSTAYLAAGRDSLRLPILAHDVDTAGIVSTAVPVTIRYLAIRHSLDGPAIATRAADVDLEWVYVNPARDAFATGRGIVVADAPTLARLHRVFVADVRGAGIRVTNPSGGSLADVTVRGVRAAAGASGAGIEIVGGSGTQIARALVRSTAGPQVLVQGADATSLSAVNLAGEAQLLAVRDATGATSIDAPVLDMRRQTGDAFTGNSETDGRSGLEVRASAGVTVRDGRFTDASGATSKMDAVRLVDARGGAGGPTFGLRLERAVFTGGRHAIRSERSTLELSGSRIDGSALLPISLEQGDTARLVSDTLVLGVQGCVRGTAAALVVTGSLIDRCGTLTQPAVDLTGGSLDLETTEVRGSSGRAVAVAAGTRARLRGATLVSAGGATAGSTGTGVVELTADAIDVSQSRVDGFTAHAGIAADGLVVRVDSNTLTRNAIGLRFARSPSSSPTGNDLWDNVMAGAINDDATLPITAPDNWWGDIRGPEGGADPDAVGDPIFGAFDLTPLRGGPRVPGAGTAALRMLRGNGQVGPANVFLPQRLSVRVVDAQGRAVAGVLVTFTSLSSRGQLDDGSTVYTVSSNASGIAETRLRITRSNEQVTVRASASGASSITFTASTP
jgi:hypothetical protein